MRGASHIDAGATRSGGRRRRWPSGAWLLAWLLVAAPSVTAAQDGHPVRARLLADVDAVDAGSTFTLGVLLEQDPGWHTYWAFQGDAGQPTRVDWRLPAGFEVGPLQWPGPHRYQEAGDLTVFGYADEVLLLTEARAPATRAGSLRIGAHVQWLVCREMCIPGDTTLTLQLPAGAPRPAHSETFARYRARVPTPYTPADAVVWEPTVRAGDGGALEVSVRLRAEHARAETPDFYPLDDCDCVEAGPRIEDGPRAARAQLRLVPYGGRPLPSSLRGVVVFADVEGGTQYRSVRFDLAPSGFDLLAADFTAGDGAAGSLWAYLLMAVVGGLILNLMPCVLPVISLKAMSLVSQAGEAPGRVRQLGLAFVAGVVATFLVLAAVVVALKAGGEQIGWGFQFQSPAFVLALTSLVFVLALSLFGVVTVRLPGASGDLGGLAEGEGLPASFFNGVLATILATPCTAPVLGTALGFAFSQPAPTVFAIFTATGVGLALPYLLLAWRPRWVGFLPRPGAWMERFKQGMGFLLMATVLWLLWVTGKQLGMEAVVWTAAFLLCLALGAWILGSWVDLRSSARRRRLAWAATLLLVAAGYGVFLHPLLAAPVDAPAPETASGWEAFDVDRVEALLADGRTVFIDFTAEWCWTCKVNERTVLADERVRDRFAALDVALVKADWTNRDPDITRMLRAFGRSGVPLYVIFPAHRPDEPIVLPEVITAGIVLDRLERAAAAAGS